jgi:hypothetical protein
MNHRGLDAIIRKVNRITYFMIPLDSPILNFFYFIKSGATVIVHGYPA